MGLNRSTLTDPKAERDEFIDILVDEYDIDEERLTDDLRDIASHTESILDDHDLECSTEFTQMVQTMILEKMINAGIRGNSTVDTHLSRFEQDLRSADQFRGTLTMISGMIPIRIEGEVPEEVDQVTKLAYTEDGL